MKRILILALIFASCAGCYNLPGNGGPAQFVIGLGPRGAFSLVPDPNKKKKNRWQEIYLLDFTGVLKGGKSDMGALVLKPLTRGGGYKTAASLSPDGSRLCYLVMGEGVRLFVASPNGDDPRAILDGKNIAFFPSWSGDGRYIAFHANLVTPAIQKRDAKEKPLDKELWVVDPEDGTTQKIESNPVFWRPLWLKGSHKILRVDGKCEKPGEIFKGRIVREEIGTGKSVVIADGFFYFGEAAAFDWCFAPDGSLFYISFEPVPQLVGKTYGRDATPEYVLASSRWDKKAWLKIKGRPSTIALSPDGILLAITTEWISKGKIYRGLWTCDVNSGRFDKIVDNGGDWRIHLAMPFWLSDNFLGYLRIKSEAKKTADEINVFDIKARKEYRLGGILKKIFGKLRR